MGEEIIKYKDKVEKLFIAKDIDVRLKSTTKEVEITTKHIVVNGKKGFDSQRVVSVECDWQLRIPLACIQNIFLQSFKAEGLMQFHKDAVGLEAMMDGVLMNYAIFTKHPDDLCKAIEDSIPQ